MGPGRAAAAPRAGAQRGLRGLPQGGLLFRALRQRVGRTKKRFPDDIENIFL